MAKAVAKRKLKNSYLEKNMNKKVVKHEVKKETKTGNMQNRFTKMFDGVKDIKKVRMDAFEEEQINGLYKRNGANRHIHTNNNNNEEADFFTKVKRKYLIRLSLQGISMLAIFVFCLCVKYMDLKIVKNSEICKNIIKEFNTNYTKEEILQEVTNTWDKAYFYIDPIVPDSLSQKTVAVFSNMFKKPEGELTVEKNSEVNVYEEKTVEIYKEPVAKVEEEKIDTKNTLDNENSQSIAEQANEKLSEQDKTLLAIKESKVKFTKPTAGVITSRYGEREVIFEGVDSYHYGTDIANIEGTNIYSSIDGSVTVCSTNNETGKYIEIQNGSITTRYCHLSEQLVKVGDNVKSGDLIGKMGETGMATGPHLHFEIMYNRTRVDAEKVLNLV